MFQFFFEKKRGRWARRRLAPPPLSRFRMGKGVFLALAAAAKVRSRAAAAKVRSRAWAQAAREKRRRREKKDAPRE